eukprot:Colp12_sorted_trinity150504_noHs@3371
MADVVDGPVCTIDHVVEWGELQKHLEQLSTLNSDTIQPTHVAIVNILGKYQEQSQLLDPHLETIVGSLLAHVQKHVTSKESQADPKSSAFVHQICKLLYTVTKVRGYKPVVKLFSHEVAELEPVFKFLQSQSPKDHETWETRYTLLLWLSNLSLIPFEMSLVDWGSGETSLKHVLVETAKGYLGASDRAREAAALLLARFLTRPDVCGTPLASFL